MTVRSPSSTAPGSLSGKPIVYVGSNSDDLRQAVANAVNGQRIVLTESATYFANSPTDFHFAADVEIEGNGATIAPADPTTFWAGDRALMKYRRRLLNTGVYTPTTAVTAGQQTFAFPAGWGYVPSVGDKVTFYSDDVWLANGTYKHGMIATITKVSGQTATLSQPFYAGFAVKQVVVYAKGTFRAKNVNFDMTGVPFDLNYLSHGLIVEGATSPEIDGLNFFGNDNSHVGAGIYNGEGGWALNCSASSFWNALGIAGGGRLGYGINVSQNGFTVQGGTFWRCKHAVATGASRDFKMVAPIVRDTTVYEDPSDLATAVGGSLDAHAAYIGRPVFKNNTVFCLKQAFNIRGGAGLVENNTVKRITTDTSPLVSTAGDSPFTSLKVIGNAIDHPVGAPVIGRTWGTTEACSGVEVRKNSITGGGTLVSVYNIDAVLSGWRIEGNEVDAGGTTSVLNIQMLANGRFTDSKVNDNTFSTEAVIGINVGAMNVTIAKQPRVDNVEFSRNRAKMTAGTASKFLVLGYLAGSNVLIVDNDANHTTEAASIDISSCSLNDLKVTDNHTTNGMIRFNQFGTTGSADTYDNAEVLRNHVTGINSAYFVQEGAEDIVFTGSSRFAGNTCKLSGSVRAFVWSCRASSGAWAASTEFDFSGNNLVSASGVAVVQLTANATGHKILFRNNVLSAAIEDLSGTYYGLPIGNTNRAGTQSWKGGTTFKPSDSTLRAAAAPTTGTWALNDIVWNSAPANAAGTPVGWICVAAGTPGTWRPFGVTT